MHLFVNLNRCSAGVSCALTFSIKASSIASGSGSMATVPSCCLTPNNFEPGLHLLEGHAFELSSFITDHLMAEYIFCPFFIKWPCDNAPEDWSRKFPTLNWPGKFKRSAVSGK